MSRELLASSREVRTAAIRLRRRIGATLKGSFQQTVDEGVPPRFGRLLEDLGGGDGRTT